MTDRSDGRDYPSSEELIRRARRDEAGSDAGTESDPRDAATEPAPDEAAGRAPQQDHEERNGGIAPHESTASPPEPGDEGGHVPGTGDRSRAPWARLWSVGRWVVGGVILLSLLGGWFQSTTTLDDLDVGDCFADPGVGIEVSEVDIVDCDEQHDFELYALVDLGSSSRDFPGTEALFEELETDCVDRFPLYVGSDYLTSEYDFVAFTPVREGWESGDRTGMCALYAFGDGFVIVPSVGSAHSSGR